MIRLSISMLAIFGASILFACAPPTKYSKSTSPHHAKDRSHYRLEHELWQRSNRARSQKSLMALARDPELDAVARSHSLEMARHAYLSHHNRAGLNPLERTQKRGVSGFYMLSENIGVTNEFPPTEHIVQGWLHSPVHRKNLLEGAYTTTGIGVAQSPDGRIYFTQLYVAKKRHQTTHQRR